MNEVELTLDGNAIAGLLAELFGREMTIADWHDGDGQALVLLLEGVLLFLNAAARPTPFTLPGPGWADGWTLYVDTAGGVAAGTAAAPGSVVTLAPHSLVILEKASPRS